MIVNALDSYFSKIQNIQSYLKEPKNYDKAIKEAEALYQNGVEIAHRQINKCLCGFNQL
jgi:hypothetical protein